jgi:hypothetical protein
MCLFQCLGHLTLVSPCHVSVSTFRCVSVSTFVFARARLRASLFQRLGRLTLVLCFDVSLFQRLGHLTLVLCVSMSIPFERFAVYTLSRFMRCVVRLCSASRCYYSCVHQRILFIVNCFMSLFQRLVKVLCFAVSPCHCFNVWVKVPCFNVSLFPMWLSFRW